MAFELSAEERRIMLETLEQELGRLKAEINRTETHDFKSQLKVREAVLVAVIERLGSGVG